MKDLIYREDAINAVTGWETDPTDEELEYALSNVPSADENKWFRVTDCLPEINRRILFVPRHQDTIIIGMMDECYIFRTQFLNTPFDRDEINVWMYFNLDIPKDD